MGNESSHVHYVRADAAHRRVTVCGREVLVVAMICVLVWVAVIYAPMCFLPLPRFDSVAR